MAEICVSNLTFCYEGSFDNIFENGQLYVTLSRGTDPKNLKILYSKSLNFKNYFVNVLKTDENVKTFYRENDFLDLENDEE